MIKRLQDEDLGIFYLRYMDILENYDLSNISDKQIEELKEKLEELKRETNKEDFYLTIYKIL